MLYLLQGKLYDLNWMRTCGKSLDQGGSLALVLEGIQADESMASVKAHQAVGVVDDVSPAVFGLKGYSFVWVDGSIDADFVPLSHQLTDDVDVRSV